MSDNFVAAQIFSFPPRKVKGWSKKIVNTAAVDTSQMVVAIDIAVEMGLAAEFQLFRRPHPSQQFKVPIDCAEAYLRYTTANQLEQHNCRGVRSHSLEFLQDHLSLPGIALKAVHCLPKSDC